MRLHVAFVVIGLTVFLGAVDQTAIATALPVLQEGLGTSITWAGWTISVYALGQVLVMPLVGPLGDRLGGRRLLLGSVVVFLLCSILCGLATAIGSLVAFRAVQGVAAGAFTPVAIALVSDAYPANRDRMIALLSTVFPFGAVLGPALGSLVVISLGWRGIFWMNVPVCLLILALGGVLDRRPPAGERTPLDVRGAVLVLGTLFAALVAVSLGGGVGGVSIPAVVVPAIALAAVGAWSLVRHLRRTADPIVLPDLLLGRRFQRLNVINFVFGVAAIGQAAIVPFYVEVRYGLGAAVGGLILTVRAVGMVAASALGVVLIRRLGFRPLLVVGSCLIVAGLTGYVLPAPGSGGAVVVLAVAAALTGLGMGVAAPASSNAGLHLEPARAAEVSGLRGMFRQTGGMAGVSVLTAVSTASVAGRAEAVAHLVLAGLMAGVAFLAVGLPNHRGTW